MISFEDFNRAAEFLPAVDAEGMPIIRIAGVLVAASVKGNALHLAVDAELADPSIVFPECGCLQLVVTCGQKTVFDASDQEECLTPR